MTRSGSEYIAALKDGRSVFLNGERVSDVAAHPAFAEAVKSVARLYDIANDPANRELMTFPSAQDGGPVNKAWLVPRSQQDLVARRLAHKRWSDETYGLLGRSPDHVASFFAGFLGAQEMFARGGQQFADNVAQYYARASDEDLYLAYTIVHPTVDRNKPPHQQPEPNLYASVYKERDDGAVIRGAQMIGTGGVLADHIFCTVILPLQKGDEDYAISFVTPANAPGVKIYTRRPYGVGPTSVFDYPLSSRLDETDSLIVFDDVFVPWEHFFVYRNLELTFLQFVETSAHVLGNTQAQIRFWSKMQFLVGLVKRIYDRSGQSSRMDAQAQLGELATQAAMVEGLVLAAEANPVTDKYGVVWPNPSMLYANQTIQQDLYPEVITKARGMMGGSLIQLPSSAADFANPEAAADINRYIRWPNVEAEERVKLLKLLWDLLGSEFAGRHIQYEMFYAGQPAVNKLKEFRAYDWTAAERLVDHCLSSYGLESEAASSARRSDLPSTH